MSQYRDGFAGAREQVQERRARVDDLLRKLTPLHRAVFDMSAIDRAYARATEPSVSIQEAFSLFDKLLIAIPLALEESGAHLDLRGEAPASMLGGRGIGPDVYPLMVEATRRHGVEVLREEGGARTLITIDGVAISLAARAQSIGEKIDSEGGTSWLLCAAAIAVPPALPRLRVCLSAFGDGVLAKLGLLEDHPTGDVVFDNAFLIRGDEHVAHSLLTEPVRKALLRLDEIAPVLDVNAGRAQVSWAERWRDEEEQIVRRGALDALLGIARALAVSSTNV